MLFRLCKLRYPVNFYTIAFKVCILYVPIDNYTLFLQPVCIKVFIGNAVFVLITLKLKTNIEMAQPLGFQVLRSFLSGWP